MNTLNIYKQYQPSCQGEHVDPEYTFVNRRWERTDRQGKGPIVETLTRQDGETDAQFSVRASKRASEIDRELGCSRCYR